MLDDLATALPPAGAIAQGEEVGERDSALLKRFWVAFFGPEIEGGPPFVLRGEGWKQAGFQRDDPISDLRACGLLALQQLVRASFYVYASDARFFVTTKPDCHARRFISLKSMGTSRAPCVRRSEEMTH
jgi:hypothetical protein